MDQVQEQEPEEDSGENGYWLPVAFVNDTGEPTILWYWRRQTG